MRHTYLSSPGRGFGNLGNLWYIISSISNIPMHCLSDRARRSFEGVLCEVCKIDNKFEQY